MQWSIVYLVLSIITLIFGIWNMSRKNNFFLSLIGILWFVVILLEFFIPSYNIQIISGFPVISRLIIYIVVPIFIIIAFSYRGFRK